MSNGAPIKCSERGERRAQEPLALSLTAGDSSAMGKSQDKSWLVFGLAGFRVDLVADVFRVRGRF